MIPDSSGRPRVTRRQVMIAGGAFIAAAVSGCAPTGSSGRSSGSAPEPGATLPPGTAVVTRGLSIDRQYLMLPAVPNFDKYDIRLIKSMGFEHVKLIVNPEPHKIGAGVDPQSMNYVDTIIKLVVDEGLPAVVCIHPEHAFKLKVLGDWDEFQAMLGFYSEFAAHLAERWSPAQVILQLMTEPTGNRWGWNTMQPAIWKAVRSTMPEHSLILSGDQLAVIEGLVNVEPVDDDNVWYCFGFYEPFMFTFQGGPWTTGFLRYLQHVPYPSSPEAIEEGLDDILAHVPDNLLDEAETALVEYGEERWKKDRLAARLQIALDWAASNSDRKLWVTEWGVYHASTRAGDRYTFIRDARELFDAHGVGWAYWSFNETQTVLTPENQIDPDMIRALGLTMRDG